MLSMQKSNTPSANQADFQRMSMHGVPPFSSQPDSSKIVPVTLGTRFGATHSGKDILLYNDPSVIAALAQQFCNCGKRYITHSKFAKYPMLHRPKVVPAFCTSLYSNATLEIFEMHMHETFAKTVKPV